MRLGLWRKSLLLLASATCLASCVGRTLESIPLDDAEVQSSGIIYSLPRGYLPLSIVKNKEGEVEITEPVQKILPDPNARFMLRLRNSAFAHDDQTVMTTADGLLSTVDAVNEDKSEEIVKKIIELVTNVASIPTFLTDAGRAQPYSVTTLIDPFNHDAELQRIEKITDFRLSITDLSGNKLHFYDPEGEKDVAASCNASVCFRILTPVMLTIQDKMTKDGKGGQILSRFIVLVPNPYLVATYDVRRAPCIKKTNGLVFTNGVLTKIHVDKPSEVLECLSIPIDVAKAIVSIPAELIKVKVENYNRDAGLAEAQTKAINAQIALLNAQAAYLARTSPPAGPAKTN